MFPHEEIYITVDYKIKDFAFLGDFKWRLQPRNQEKAGTQKVGDEELGKIIRSTDVSLETKAKITHTLIVPITMHRRESWTVKKAERKKQLIHFIYGVEGELSTDTLDLQKDKLEGPRVN